MDQEKTEEVLGMTRCARCGHRLDGEIECPFCSLFPDPPRQHVLPKWVYLTACFLTSPLSSYFVLTRRRLNLFEKIVAVSGCMLWLGLYLL
jgi:hypothetical protein